MDRIIIFRSINENGLFSTYDYRFIGLYFFNKKRIRGKRKCWEAITV